MPGNTANEMVPPSQQSGYGSDPHVPFWHDLAEPSHVHGAREARGISDLPTRLTRASVVEIRHPLNGAGVPRTLVDCIGVVSRKPIMNAVVLGWSGAFYQDGRPKLQRTQRNFVSRVRFSDDATERMQQMLQDLDSHGWDGDEVCIAFYNRQPVILGNFEHRLAYADVENNGLEALLPDGQRLQDSTGVFPELPLFTAGRNTWPDARNFRQGIYLSTWWERAGGVGEIREVDPTTDTLKSSTAARWEFSTETVKVRGVDLRASAGQNDTAGSWFDLTAVELTVGGADFTIDGLASGASTLALQLTSAVGGDKIGDNPASVTRFPELRAVIDQQAKQIADLQIKHNALSASVRQLAGAINLITTVTPGSVALTTATITLATFLAGNDATEAPPDPGTLDAMRSSVARVGV